MNDIIISSLAVSAKQRYKETLVQLEEIKEVALARADGRTKSGMLGRIFGTLEWIIVFCFAIQYVKASHSNALLVFTAVALFALFAVLLADEILGYVYYGKIFGYVEKIDLLMQSVDYSEGLIEENQKQLVKNGG